MSFLLLMLRRLWLRLRETFFFCRHHPKSTISLIVIFLIVWASYAVTRPPKPEYVTAQSTRGDLRQIVEAVGTVTSERALELQFPALDVVLQVLVKEGDSVRAGQTLAQLRSGTLAAGIASARANLLSAEAALRALEEGARPENIAITRAQVENRRASFMAAQQSAAAAESNIADAERQLVALRNEASVALSGYVTTAGSTASQQLASTKTTLAVLRGVFDANDVQDSVVKSGTLDYQVLRQSIIAALDAVSTAQSAPIPTDYHAAIRTLSSARSVVAIAADVLIRGYDLVAALPITSVFTTTSRETNKTTVATQKGAAQTALAALDSALKTLQDASATYDTRIVAQETQVTSLRGTRDRARADVVTAETALRIEEASLALAEAPPRQTDLDAARARVRQAQADLARASAQYADTILSAPVDGVITKVNIKPGEIRPSSEPSITMLGRSPFRIEMFVSEVDIPRVRVHQTGSVTLDAFRGQPFALRVSEIDSAATDKDGVPKYRVRLDFLATDDGLRVGMTGDAEIETGRRGDVVSVPARAVIMGSGTSVVRVLRGKEVESLPVVMGMEGAGGFVEVTGIDEGETVVVLQKN